MKRLGVLVTLAALFGATRFAPAATFMKPELQNEHVRVLRFRLGPHERIPMHEVPPHLAIWLTDANLKLSYPDGRTDIRHFRAGEARWVSIGKHAGENVGDRAVEFLAIEPAACAPTK